MRKAEEDLFGAQSLAGQSKSSWLYDQICFLAQQASEKFLKALLEELNISIPFTHRLQDLLNLLLPHHPTLRGLRRGLIFLTRFAVSTRYPGESASKRQAVAALRWAEVVAVGCRGTLGIKPPRLRR